ATAIVGVLAHLQGAARPTDRADRAVQPHVAQVGHLIAEAHGLAAIVGVAIDGDRALAPTAALTGAPAAAGTVAAAGAAGPIVLIVAAMALADQTAVVVADVAAGAARQFDRGLAHIAARVAAIGIETALVHI